jgi:hypothetical protein
LKKSKKILGYLKNCLYIYNIENLKIKVMKKIVLAVAVALSLASCTENVRVKMWGGNGKIHLEPGKKLEMVTWKEAELWILTSNRPDSVKPQTYQFSEKSSFGVIEGTYVIVEQ